jgi:hypothetical protein
MVALAQATSDLSTLVDAVTAADLAQTLQGEGPFTVFAPTNEAFSALGDTLLLAENQEQLASVLSYHVVPSRALAADLTDGQTLETVNGETLEVQVEGDTVTVGGATVTEADIEASNGVAHVIDTVLQRQGQRRPGRRRGSRPRPAPLRARARRRPGARPSRRRAGSPAGAVPRGSGGGRPRRRTSSPGWRSCRRCR